MAWWLPFGEKKGEISTYYNLLLVCLFFVCLVVCSLFGCLLVCCISSQLLGQLGIIFSGVDRGQAEFGEDRSKTLLSEVGGLNLMHE